MNTEAKNLCKSIMKECDIDFSKSSCDFEDGDGATTIDASCVAVSDTKSTAVQTERYNKIRNKTTTTEIQLVPKIERKVDESRAHVCDIHAIITLNVVARNDKSPKSISIEPSVKMLTKSSLTESKRTGCTCTKNESAEKGGCAESCQYSCKYGGVGPCNAFSLGTADYRMLLREKCNSMLIGGCRVPVCRNFKNKL